MLKICKVLNNCDNAYVKSDYQIFIMVSKLNKQISVSSFLSEGPISSAMCQNQAKLSKKKLFVTLSI